MINESIFKGHFILLKWTDVINLTLSRHNYISFVLKTLRERKKCPKNNENKIVFYLHSSNILKKSLPNEFQHDSFLGGGGAGGRKVEKITDIIVRTFLINEKRRTLVEIQNIHENTDEEMYVLLFFSPYNRLYKYTLKYGKSFIHMKCHKMENCLLADVIDLHNFINLPFSAATKSQLFEVWSKYWAKSGILSLLSFI